MMTIGLDVGGANVKAAVVEPDGSVRTASRVHEVWRDRAGLGAAIAATVAAVQRTPAEPVALTTTAELSDAFRTKREGVLCVLDATVAATAGRPLRVLTTDGALVTEPAARARPLDVAAANWVASATIVAERHPDAILVDTGSTTTDVIPLIDGRIAVDGRTDLDRLRHGELVYTGAVRTNVAAIAATLPVRGGDCPVASELFAVSADAHIVLGHLRGEDVEGPFPDGRPGTVAFARERLARVVCSDVEQLAAAEIDALARAVHAAQVAAIAAAIGGVAGRYPTPPRVVALGIGAFLARAAAAAAGCPVVALEGPWAGGGGDVAPALALAILADREG